jgi:hypothetical protein
MALKLKLAYLDQNIFDGMEIVEEQNKLGSGNSLYIQGPYTGVAKNKNKRVYPKEELDRDINRYINEMVNTNRAMGELNHSQTAEVNPERACHMVTQLHEDNGTWYGKSKILSGEGLPIGNLVKGLINQGVSLGVSTRSLGTLEESTDHNIVRNLHIVAWDMVADPSFPTAFVNGILESREFVIGDSGTYEESYANFDKSLNSLPKKDVERYLRDQVIRFINSLN